MIPAVDQVLRGFAGTLLTQIIPDLGEGYASGTLSLMGMVLFMCAAEHDRAADVRHAENGELRALFADAAGHVADAALAQRLRAAAHTADPSLRIGDLDVANDALKRLLIDLHAHVEEQPTNDARTLERRIWTWLTLATDRRRIDLPI